jgi:hypothetical protein
MGQTRARSGDARRSSKSTSVEKPRELLAREAIAPLAAQGDLTSTYVRWQQLTAEPQYQPATFGRYSRRRW